MCVFIDYDHKRHWKNARNHVILYSTPRIVLCSSDLTGYVYYSSRNAFFSCGAFRGLVSVFFYVPKA